MKRVLKPRKPRDSSQGEGLLAANVTRRDFVKKAGLFTLSASSLPTILLACSTGGGTTTKKGPKTLTCRTW